MGVKFGAEWQVLWSDLDLAFVASLWVLFPLQWALSFVYLPRDFFPGQADVSDGLMYV